MRCAGGAWEYAQRKFNEMRDYRCMPDAVTFTALISAYEKGAQQPHQPSMWQRALRAYEHVCPKTSPISCRVPKLGSHRMCTSHTLR